MNERDYELIGMITKAVLDHEGLTRAQILGGNRAISHDDFMEQAERTTLLRSIPLRMEVLDYLQNHIFEAEAERNAARGITRNIDYRIKETDHRREVKLMRAILGSMQLSEDYMLALDDSVDRVFSAINADPWLAQAQEKWPRLNRESRQDALVRARDIHAHYQTMAGVSVDESLTVTFNEKAKTLSPDAESRPLVTLGSYQDNLQNTLKPPPSLFEKIVRKKPPEFYAEIKYNIHKDANFMARSFAEAMGIMHHEEQHAMQSALMRAYKTGQIAKDHPLHRDAQILWHTQERHAYISPYLYSLYRYQAMEQDTFYLQDRMEERLDTRLGQNVTHPTPRTAPPAPPVK